MSTSSDSVSFRSRPSESWTRDDFVAGSQAGSLRGTAGQHVLDEKAAGGVGGHFKSKTVALHVDANGAMLLRRGDDIRIGIERTQHGLAANAQRVLLIQSLGLADLGADGANQVDHGAIVENGVAPRREGRHQRGRWIDVWLHRGLLGRLLLRLVDAAVQIARQRQTSGFVQTRQRCLEQIGPRHRADVEFADHVDGRDKVISERLIGVGRGGHAGGRRRRRRRRRRGNGRGVGGDGEHKRCGQGQADTHAKSSSRNGERTSGAIL